MAYILNCTPDCIHPYFVRNAQSERNAKVERYPSKNDKWLVGNSKKADGIESSSPIKILMKRLYLCIGN